MPPSSAEPITTRFDDGASPSARIATMRSAMQPSELRVADLIASRPEVALEATAQEVADLAGVGRTSVVRACQTLGYRGYPQLRVALAAELAHATSAPDFGSSALGMIRTDVTALANALPQITAVLTEADVEAAVAQLVSAGRVLVLANGLSAPLANDLAMRLTSVGRTADAVSDVIGQQIAARQLKPGDLCVVISGSGANEATLRVARAARASGAHLLALTTLRHSPLEALANLTLVVASPTTTFRTELERTSRIALAVLLESLVGVVTVRLGPTAVAAREHVLDILSENLSD